MPNAFILNAGVLELAERSKGAVLFLVIWYGYCPIKNWKIDIRMIFFPYDIYILL